MDKQLTMSFLTDELAEVRTHKKEFLGQMDRLVPWGEWVKKIQAALLQRRAREQALRPGTDASDLRIAKPVQPGGYGGDERNH